MREDFYIISFIKIMKDLRVKKYSSWLQWHIPVVPATWEAEAEGLQVQVQAWQFSETLSQWVS